MLKEHRGIQRIFQKYKGLKKDFPHSHSIQIMSSSASKSSNSPSLFPKWPKAVHDTNGDYRVESAFLESTLHSSTSQENLYQHQSKIPHLPIPSVSETLSKLASTALPLLDIPISKVSFNSASDNEKTSFLQAIENFPTQVAKLQLQERLMKRKNEDYKDSSWLQHWWNTMGYLQVRDSIVINVSYFYHFKNDPTLPNKSSIPTATDLSVPRGAVLLCQLAKFHKQVCSVTLSPPYIGRKQKKYSSLLMQYTI